MSPAPTRAPGLTSPKVGSQQEEWDAGDTRAGLGDTAGTALCPHSHHGDHLWLRPGFCPFCLYGRGSWDLHFSLKLRGEGRA